jgi:serine/threonine protein kinase
MVAVKILPAHLSDKPQLKQRIERSKDDRRSQSSAHLHALRCRPSGRNDFLVMEYLEGETLAERQAKGPLALDDALRYAIEIADALNKAHGLSDTPRLEARQCHADEIRDQAFRFRCREVARDRQPTVLTENLVSDRVGIGELKPELERPVQRGYFGLKF